MVWEQHRPANVRHCRDRQLRRSPPTRRSRSTQVRASATVPNVVGQSKTTADATLTAAGFATGNVNAVYYPGAGGSGAHPVSGRRYQRADGRSGRAAGLAGAAAGAAAEPRRAVAHRGADALTGLRLHRYRQSRFVADRASEPGARPESGVRDRARRPAIRSRWTVSIGPPLTGTVAQVIVEPAPIGDASRRRNR